MLGGKSRSRTHTRHLVGAAAGTCASLIVLGLTAAAPAVAADIPDFRPDQWALTSIGAQEVWDSTQGQGVTVAMPGVSADEEHPDLRDNVVIDSEFGDNGSDDEQGTAAAGLVAAHGHGLDADGGVLGVAPTASVQVLPTQDDVAGAVRHAATEGAQVILLPEEVGDDEELFEATAAAASGGALVVGPAGGDEDPNVLRVAGVDEDGALIPGSPEATGIDLIAPGADLRTAGQDMRQADVTGAPYAAAVTAGAAALLASEYPQLTPAQVREALVEGAQQGPGGLPSLHVGDAFAQASGTAEDVPLIDNELVQESDTGIPVWVWFALVGVVFVIVVLLLVLWVRRSTADPYGVQAEREAEEEELAAARAEQAKAEERPSRRKKGGRRRKSR
ncbi:S8 family serine peptidase [Nocardiopsis sp. MG754419]|uniref:S8 family serine peptidase n=1 Tax=Nocardiopsis sp. MG754419 TaxID=2259865 RepID=UPI001BA76105|nr:S8 family serine peptidase [Nocardiopsis sp. MG754419]MBR8742554.1 peptidase S8 [Nocardiopsis sp. MG754419]